MLPIIAAVSAKVLPLIWAAIARYYTAEPVSAVLTTLDAAHKVVKFLRSRKDQDEHRG